MILLLLIIGCKLTFCFGFIFIDLFKQHIFFLQIKFKNNSYKFIFKTTPASLAAERCCRV